MINPIRKPLAILLFLAIKALLLGQSVSYTPSTDIIANPERGLQKYSITASDYATTTGANNLAVSILNSWKASSDKVTVVYRYFLLDAFLNSDINTTYLDNIQQDFNNIRTAGFKVIVRFSYSNIQGTTAQQPTKSQILTHISQLSPILNSNKDVIFSHQAGFIGTWGEWYYTNSTEFGTEGNISATQWANRKDIVDAMLAATPVSVPIQVRYAGIKTMMYGVTPLTEQTAYQNTPKARIGFFNDAFLNDYGDQGTYSISSQCENPVGTTDYNFISNETKYLPMTGETNGLNMCNNGFRTTSANALHELDLTNWTTINRDYYIPFWDQAINSNDYDEILKNLGYRFSLNSSTITTNNASFDLVLDISNAGFARPFKQRNVYLVLENTTTNAITTALINTDVRAWEETVSITQTFNLGLSGTFQLYLWLPDVEPSLEMNPDYSIQFANLNTWESTTGYNNLLQTVSLSTENCDVGDPCDDGDANTFNDVFDANCVCTGTTCTIITIDSNDFESGFGIWNDGGSDCIFTTFPVAAYSGSNSIALRDNSPSSVMTTNDMDLSAYEEITVDFAFIGRSMENGEDFWLQLSTDGGLTFTTVASWVNGTDFNNGRNHYLESVVISGPFTSTTSLRFRCDATANNDIVYLDDVLISGCINSNVTEEKENTEMIVIEANTKIEVPTENEGSNFSTLAFSELKLAPNPTRDQLNVSFTSLETNEVQLFVTNIAGQRIWSKTISVEEGGFNTKLNTSNYAPGIYFITLMTADQQMSQKFVVVE